MLLKRPSRSHYSALAYFITLAARAPFIKMLQCAPENVKKKTHHTLIWSCCIAEWVEDDCMSWPRFWCLIRACVQPHNCTTLGVNSCEKALFLLHCIWSFTSIWLFLPPHNPPPFPHFSSSPLPLSGGASTSMWLAHLRFFLSFSLWLAHLISRQSALQAANYRPCCGAQGRM